VIHQQPTSGLGVADVLARLAGEPDIPEPHAPGTHPLWTDPHISASMLATHLDPHVDLASRRPETIDATVAWIAGQIPSGGRVLDLGCGPGLYAERFARAGFDVTGVDFSERSIGYARSRDADVRYLLGDYREIDLTGRFDAVVLIFCDLGTFSPADTRRILERVRGWLTPNGLFAFDVVAPPCREDSEQHRDWGSADTGFWAPVPHAWLSRTLRYEPGPTYLDEHVVVTTDEMRIYRVWERCFTEAAIRTELAAAGLSVRSVHGDLTGATYDPERSPLLGVLATPA
jgi:SAM-dependent methyltransferase